MYKGTQIQEAFCFFSESNSCFPSISTLKLKNGKVVKMSELQIGDQVKTGNRKKTVK